MAAAATAAAAAAAAAAVAAAAAAAVATDVVAFVVVVAGSLLPDVVLVAQFATELGAAVALPSRLSFRRTAYLLVFLPTAVIMC